MIAMPAIAPPVPPGVWCHTAFWGQLAGRQFTDIRGSLAMSFGALLFSFHGRINRKPFWLTTIAIVVIISILVGLLIVFAGAAFLTGDISALGGFALLIVIFYIPLLWISLALGAKRLHDRDKSAWWLLLFYLLPAVIGNAGPYAGGPEIVFTVASLAISLWALVELGFLRGTAGPNRYGRDPLAA
jgi:uncharacterized membrane protein YhaH (DUF805 family)